jgi:hypothetical protein
MTPIESIILLKERMMDIEARDYSFKSLFISNITEEDLILDVVEK